MSEGESEGQIWRDRVHEVEDVYHAHLVLVRDMAVVEIFLNAKHCLSHLCLRRIHLEHSVECYAI